MNKYLEKIAKSKESLPYRDRVEVIIQKDNKVLIMKCKNKETGESWYAFPGGGVDGQTEINAAKNECLEEVGIKVKNLKKIGSSFKEEGGMSKKDNRHLEFRGSNTVWYTADFDKIDKSKLGDDGDEGKYQFKSILKALEDVKGDRGIAIHRQGVLNALKGSNRFLEKITSSSKPS